MRKTTVARASFLIRLRVQSDGTWAGRVEQIGSGCEAKFHDPRELIERLTAMVGGAAPPAETHEPSAKEIY